MPSYESLIDRTYFVGQITVGQAENQAVEDELKIFINKYEQKFLSALLGPSLFPAFHTGMKGTTIEERWKRMAYGVDFILDASKVKTGCTWNEYGTVKQIPRKTYRDKMRINFKGLLNQSDSTAPQSPIANYVYYYWTYNRATTTGGVGETKQLNHNGAIANDHHKVAMAWHEMCDDVVDFYHFLDMNITDYPEFDLDVNDRFNPQPLNIFNFY